VFAEGQKVNLDLVLYLASGARLKYVDMMANTLNDPADGATPSSTFVCNMNNRFYANDIYHDQDFLITDINPDLSPPQMDVTYWSFSDNPFRAAQKPDPLTGIFSSWNEVYLWGTQACEVWQEDGVNPISPLIGSIIEGGCAAPYSVVFANNTLIGLGNVMGKRAVMMIQGRTPKVISEPIANILQSYDVVSDAVGSLCFVGGLNVYLINFPSEDVTWAYDFKTDVWTKWCSWNIESAQHEQFHGIHSCYAKDWNAHVTMSDTGSLYEFDRDAFTDDGSVIRSSIRTGWVDHGSWDRKRSNQMIIKLKGSIQNDAKLVMRWRSDGFEDWSTPMEIDIKAGSQNDHFCKLNRMGMYRSRQYEFIMTDAADLALVGVEEDLEKMRN